MSIETQIPRPLVECPVCRGPLQTVGRLPVLRDAARSGIIAPATAAGAEAVALDVYRCHDCGRMELYDHDFLLAAS